jgi:hypothetical protein
MPVAVDFVGLIGRLNIVGIGRRLRGQRNVARELE